MKRNKAISVEALAKLIGKPTDEILLLLWDNGMEEVLDTNSLLTGKRLQEAKSILGIPTAAQLTSLKYWQTIFEMNEDELRSLLAELKLSISPLAKKVPTGGIKKLKAESRRRKTILKITKEIPIFKEERISFIPVEWRTIGKREDIIPAITSSEVLEIHYTLVKDFSTNYDPIFPAGVRDDGLLESALFRLETRIGTVSKYESIEMKGAALLHSLIHNHPFHNGNKRTALVTLLVFLDKNRQTLTCSQNDLFKFVLNVAQHRIIKDKYLDLADREVLEIAKWIYDNSRHIKLGDRVYPFRKIKQILNRYGCDIQHSGTGTNYKVLRIVKGSGIFAKTKVLTTHISVRNEGHELRIRTIKKIREDLQLDEANGIDSEAFYNQQSTSIDEFIVKYRKTLLRLERL